MHISWLPWMSSATIWETLIRDVGSSDTRRTDICFLMFRAKCVVWVFSGNWYVIYRRWGKSRQYCIFSKKELFNGSSLSYNLHNVNSGFLLLLLCRPFSTELELKLNKLYKVYGGGWDYTWWVKLTNPTLQKFTEVVHVANFYLESLKYEVFLLSHVK
jgi:hypothetical protein